MIGTLYRRVTVNAVDMDGHTTTWVIDHPRHFEPVPVAPRTGSGLEFAFHIELGPSGIQEDRS